MHDTLAVCIVRLSRIRMASTRVRPFNRHPWLISKSIRQLVTRSVENQLVAIKDTGAATEVGLLE